MLARVTQTTATAHGARTAAAPTPPARAGRIHRAWFVAAVTFVTIIGAAAFASLPGLLIDPLHEEFGWSRGTIGFAVSVNLALYGLTAPFAAALMDRFGIRRVVAVALTVIAVGARPDRLHDGAPGSSCCAGACWSAWAAAPWRWPSPRPSPTAGSSPGAAWSPASSPRPAPPASWSSCRCSPGWSSTTAGARPR